MTMSIRKVTLGSRFWYVMTRVARADGSGHAASLLTRQYAEHRTWQGRFLGWDSRVSTTANGFPAG